MRTFTHIDEFNGKCSTEEVGQPYEERWGIDDVEAGLCPPTMLGEPKPTTGKTETVMPEPEEYKPLSMKERKDLIRKVHDNALSYIANTTNQAIDENASVINKILDQSSKILAEEPEGEEITKEVLENMSTLENQKLLIIATLPDKHEKELFLQSFANLVQTPEEKKAAWRRESRAKFNDMAIEKGMWIDEHGEIVTATPEQVERFKATRKPYQDAIEHLEHVVFGGAYDEVVEGLHNKPKSWY